LHHASCESPPLLVVIGLPAPNSMAVCLRVDTQVWSLLLPAGSLSDGDFAIVSELEKMPTSDGLQAVRAAFSPAKSAALAPCFLVPCTPSELALYKIWQDMPPDCYLDRDAIPPIVVFEVLREIGVPMEERHEAAAKLGDDACKALLQAAIAARTAKRLLGSALGSVGLQQTKQDFKR